MKKTKFLEVMLGILIILVAVLFLLYMLFFNSSMFKKTYAVKGVFYNIGGLNLGSKVKINGYTIGKVANISLNPDDYSIEVDLLIDKNIIIPKDSTLELVSAGVFDGLDINVLVGKDKARLNPNDVVVNTKDYVSLEDKIGSIFLNMGK